MGAASKALLKSKTTTSVCVLPSNFCVDSSVVIKSWLSHECFDRKPSCTGVKILFFEK